MDKTAFQNPDDETITRLLRTMKRVAVVGISGNPERASHGIAKFLKYAGYRVAGVNPKLTEVLGIPVYPSLADIPGPVDVVDIFRRGEFVEPIVDAAIAKGAPAVWMQEHVVNPAAALKAQRAGLTTVMDRCIYKEWLRLLND